MILRLEEYKNSESVASRICAGGEEVDGWAADTPSPLLISTCTRSGPARNAKHRTERRSLIIRSSMLLFQKKLFTIFFPTNHCLYSRPSFPQHCLLVISPWYSAILTNPWGPILGCCRMLWGVSVSEGTDMAMAASTAFPSPPPLCPLPHPNLPLLPFSLTSPSAFLRRRRGALVVSAARNFSISLSWWWTHHSFHSIFFFTDSMTDTSDEKKQLFFDRYGLDLAEFDSSPKVFFLSSLCFLNHIFLVNFNFLFIFWLVGIWVAAETKGEGEEGERASSGAGGSTRRA